MTTMKEKMLEVFKSLGFKMEEMDDYGYGFQYEGKHFLYLYNERDESFLNIALPAVLDRDNEDDLAFYKVMNKMNSSLKYLKAYVVDDSLWLFCEHELLGDENLRKIVAHSLSCLEAGMHFLFSLVDDSETDEGDDGDKVDSL